jgi:TPP-dependent pyruvate/acetoin dehydrogenase alpha subunit
VKKARERAIAGEGPTLIEAKTYRWCGHWVADPIRYRTEDEVDEWKKKCPIKRLSLRLIKEKILTKKDIEEIDAEEKERIEAAERFAIESEDPSPEDALEDVFVSSPVEGGAR